jgi:hypothetical protein
VLRVVTGLAKVESSGKSSRYRLGFFPLLLTDLELAMLNLTQSFHPTSFSFTASRCPTSHPNPTTPATRQTKRAEQNRKAQQNFRKRREENIKLLEAKVAEFDELKKQKDLTDGVISELRLVSFFFSCHPVPPRPSSFRFAR